MKYLLVLTIILLLPLAIAQEEVTYNEEEVKTWYKNWDEVRSRAGTNIAGINQDWKSASSQDRQNTINDLINSDKSITTKGFGSDQLSINEEGHLTNGKAIFDPEKLPPGTTSVEYSESENGFVYKFDDKFLKLRNGQLNPDLSITGTGWPSDGLKWNKEGAFDQDSTGVKLEGDAQIEVGRMKVTKLLRDKPSTVSFREGDSGNEYVMGNNIKVDIKDLAIIRVPEKTTEIFIGNKQPSLPNQHIKISSDGSTIDANADDVQIDLLRKLKTLNADGNNIIVKNNDMIIRIKEDANGKSQTYINKPSEANGVTINNKRNQEGDVTTKEGLEDEVGETQKEIDEANDKLRKAEEEQKKILEEQKRILEERRKQQEESDRTQSDSGRVKYTWSGKGNLGATAITESGQHAMDAEFIISDEDLSKYGSNLGSVPDESPKTVDLTARLNIGGFKAGLGGRGNLPGGGKHITRNDLVGRFYDVSPKIAQKIFPSNKGVYYPGETVRISSGGKGSGTASVQIYGFRNNKITLTSEIKLTGQEADTIINYVNTEFRKKY